jgi:integrase
LSELYELTHVEELRTRNGPRVRHKRREPRRVSSPDQASPAEIEALLRAATTARDQFVVLLMALTGLRAGQVLGLRRQDLHLVPSAAGYELTIPGGTERCRISGEHVHVVRRRNPNGAWSKARFDFAVPIPAILVALFDRFMQERDSCLEAADNDMLIVALAGPTRGEAMSLRNLDKLFESMARAFAGFTPICCGTSLPRSSSRQAPPATNYRRYWAGATCPPPPRMCMSMSSGSASPSSGWRSDS